MQVFMADKIHFDLVSPERMLLSEEVDMVTLPGSEGYFGVLAGHAPVLSTLRPGLIDVKGGAEGDMRIFVRGGFAEVNPDKVVVLAEEAIPLAELDVAALEQNIRDAEEDVASATTDAERDRYAAKLEDLRQLRTALQSSG
jgi:F-type H+-transporting ATPase subunit epsilon